MPPASAHFHFSRDAFDCKAQSAMCLPSRSTRLPDTDAVRYLRLHEHGQARFVIGESVRYGSSHYGITSEATSSTRVEPEFHGARDGRRTAGAVPARLPRHCSFVSPSDARAGVSRAGCPTQAQRSREGWVLYWRQLFEERR